MDVLAPGRARDGKPAGVGWICTDGGTARRRTRSGCGSRRRSTARRGSTARRRRALTPRAEATTHASVLAMALHAGAGKLLAGRDSRILVSGPGGLLQVGRRGVHRKSRGNWPRWRQDWRRRSPSGAICAQGRERTNCGSGDTVERHEPTAGSRGGLPARPSTSIGRGVTNGPIPRPPAGDAIH